MASFSRLAGPSRRRLVALIVDAVKHRDKIKHLHALYEIHGIDLAILEPRDTSVHVNVQHCAIVLDLVQHAIPETK